MSDCYPLAKRDDAKRDSVMGEGKYLTRRNVLSAGDVRFLLLFLTDSIQ